MPLTSRQSQKLQRQLEKAFATQVVLQAGVEPALLAGLRLQRGSVVYDFSLRANLQRLRERLLEES